MSSSSPTFDPILSCVDSNSQSRRRSSVCPEETAYAPGQNRLSQSPATLSYATFLRDLRTRYPNLINLEREFEDPNFNGFSCVRMFDVRQTGETGHEFKTLKELCDHLGNTDSVPPAPRCTVYVVENPKLEYMATFGRHFNVDPTIFASQNRTANWEGKPEENNTPKLLLCREPNQSFTLRYGEVRYFDEIVAGLRLTDVSAGRVITVTTKHKELLNFHHVGVVRHCISFWCKENQASCWDGNVVL